MMNQQSNDLYNLYSGSRNAFAFRPATGRHLLTRLSLIALAFVAAFLFFGSLTGSVAEAGSLKGSVAEAQETPSVVGAEFGSTTGQQVVQEALKYKGVPFVLGGPQECIPGWQMDCTCLTTTVFRKFGFELPDMPTALLYYGAPVYGPPRAGDVHIWGDPGDGTGGHVAIDMGDGNIIHANMVTMSTSITPMYPSMYYDPNYLGARRLVN